MDLSSWTTWLPTEDTLVNVAVVAIMVVIGMLLWEMRSDGRRRRRDSAANDLDRLQDQ